MSHYRRSPRRSRFAAIDWSIHQSSAIAYAVGVGVKWVRRHRRVNNLPAAPLYRPKQKIGPDQLPAVLAMFDAGKSQREIAVAMGTGKGCVSKAIRAERGETEYAKRRREIAEYERMRQEDRDEIDRMAFEEWRKKNRKAG